MKQIKIFHNNRCSKSRQALAIANQLSNNVQVIDYMNCRVLKSELKQVLKELKMTPEDLLRKNESDYKEHVKGKNLNNDQPYLEKILKEGSLRASSIAGKNLKKIKEIVGFIS